MVIELLQLRRVFRYDSVERTPFAPAEQETTGIGLVGRVRLDDFSAFQGQFRLRYSSRLSVYGVCHGRKANSGWPDPVPFCSDAKKPSIFLIPLALST